MDDDAKGKHFRLVRLGKTKEVPQRAARQRPPPGDRQGRALTPSFVRPGVGPRVAAARAQRDGARVRMRARATRTLSSNARTHARTHARARTHAHTHTHTHARTRTYTHGCTRAGPVQVKEALTTGALDVNEKDPKGDTLLHLAARNGHKAIVKEVPRLRGRAGGQAAAEADREHMHDHADRGNARARRALQLLRRNCDYDTKNAAGQEAWELAYEFNYAELGDYIRDKTGLPKLEAGAADGAVKDDDDGLLDLLGEKSGAGSVPCRMRALAWAHRAPGAAALVLRECSAVRSAGTRVRSCTGAVGRLSSGRTRTDAPCARRLAGARGAGRRWQKGGQKGGQGGHARDARRQAPENAASRPQVCPPPRQADCLGAICLPLCAPLLVRSLAAPACGRRRSARHFSATLARVCTTGCTAGCTTAPWCVRN